MADVSYGSLRFREQIEFFRRKLNVNTRSWLDVWQSQHDFAFMVAGANRADLVQDLRAAVDAAIADGETLQQFRKRFDAIVEKYGWDYNGGRNWRSRVIFETNLRTSYAAGRFQQLQSIKRRMPYWEYVHADGETHPRPLHESWDGLVLDADDRWWLTHFPPGGWGCKCTVRGRGARDLAKLGKTGPDTAPPVEMEDVTIGQRSPGGPRVVEVPAGIDPGFGYVPGRAAWIRNFTPPVDPAASFALVQSAVADAARTAMPPVRAVERAAEIGADVAADAAIGRFLASFGARRGAGVIFTDATGTPIAIGDGLFPADAARALGTRLPQLPLAGAALRDPDQVWLALPDGGTLARRYVRRAALADGRTVWVIAELRRDGWAFAVLPDDGAGFPFDPAGAARIWSRKP